MTLIKLNSTFLFNLKILLKEIDSTFDYEFNVTRFQRKTIRIIFLRPSIIIHNINIILNYVKKGDIADKQIILNKSNIKEFEIIKIIKIFDLGFSQSQRFLAQIREK